MDALQIYRHKLCTIFGALEFVAAFFGALDKASADEKCRRSEISFTSGMGEKGDDVWPLSFY